MPRLLHQIGWLFVLAIPIASIARTVTFEEIFAEFRTFCEDRCKSCQNIFQRKFFYLFTCEYCFSHWVTLLMLFITDFHLLYPDWRGLMIAFFSLPFVANCYLNVYGRLRVDIHRTKAEIMQIEKARNTHIG